MISNYNILFYDHAIGCRSLQNVSILILEICEYLLNLSPKRVNDEVMNFYGRLLQKRENNKCLKNNARRRSIIMPTMFMAQLLKPAFWKSRNMDESYNFCGVKK